MVILPNRNPTDASMRVEIDRRLRANSGLPADDRVLPTGKLDVRVGKVIRHYFNS